MPAAPRRLGDLVRGVRDRIRPGTDAPPEPPEEPPPALTVVIPVYNVAQYLPECLDSVLGSSLADLEVIAVDDGSTDDCPAVLAAYAARDPRLRVLHQENAGQGPARNRAVDVARGEFLTFCDSDDTVPRKAYEVMVRTLRRTGSDFVVGAARRVKHDKARRVAWGETVHEFDRLATTIDEFPAAMQDIIACNRMFRTEFWRSRVGGFRGGIAYEDHVPMLTAYVRAERFDVLARVTYNWRLREDHTSTGQQKATVRNLLDRVEVKEEAYALLQAEATSATYDAWVGRCLDVDFPPFLTHALGGGEEYRDVLATAYRTFLDRATERALETVRHDRLVKAWLCAGRHWDALAVADEWFGRGRDPQVRLDGDHLVAVPELPAEIVGLVPAEAWRLAPAETALRSALRSVRRSGLTLRLTGYALVPGLDTTAGPPEVTAWLVDPESGTTLPLPVTNRVEPAIDVWVDDASASYPHSGFEIDVALERLAEVDDAVSWRLRLRVQHGAVAREAGVHDHVDGSAARYPRREILEIGGRQLRVEPRWSSEDGFEILVSPPGLVIAELERPTAEGLLGARFAGDLPEGLRVVARIDDQGFPAPVGDDGRFELTLPPAGEWILRASAPGIAPHQQLWPVPGPDPTAPYGEIGPGRLVWRASPDGLVRAVADGRQVRVRRVELRPGALVAEVETVGVTDDELGSAVWRGRHADVAVTGVVAQGDTVVLTAPLGVRPPPSAAYLLVVRTADGRDLEAVAGDELDEAVPATQRTDTVGLGLRLRPDRTVVADLGAPLDDEERSPGHQERLRRTHRSRDAEGATEPAVLLTAGGDLAGGLLALERALATERPDLARYWAARDASVPVPAGTTPVLVGSRRWHELLSTAQAVLAGGELPDFVVPGTGQRVLQTFAGFPVAPVGRSLWRSRGLSERAVELEVERRREQWDAVVAPTEEVAAVYRAELDLSDVLVTGHPRYDLLVGADRAAARDRVLTRLGLPADTSLTLYAPAHRDRATRARLKSTDGLDLARLAAGLGDGHVVLALGVPHARADRVVDVTPYGAVSDLVLAADAAVLDYSDLRFDWALTGRAAVFHVPDHDDYLAVVRPPIDVDTTSPGPHVTDVDAVIDAVRSHGALTDGYAAELAAFNARWHAHHDGHAAERVVALLGD